ncbi:unnamed protein product [Linum tenue]|uniref:Plant basic secretory protein (BSP) family protein n=4 Tax=Linum tenue TaxID=586396 RepID=A0AAV0MFS1_9ROSI|nr:unnamed protein product [Linum tenue]
MSQNIFLLSLLVSLSAAVAQVINFTAINTTPETAGGAIFTRQVGTNYTCHVMSNATNFIWTSVFRETTNGSRRDFSNVTLLVKDMDGVAYTSDNEISLSAQYVGNYSDGGNDVRREVAGVVYHEMTHVWQWMGGGQGDIAPGGLIEGIADFVRLRAGLAPPPGRWVKPGEGDKWDQGYDVTAMFLDYCDGLRNDGFVAELNKKLRDDYNVTFFKELLGKSVDELWKDYKAKYGK